MKKTAVLLALLLLLSILCPAGTAGAAAAPPPEDTFHTETLLLIDQNTGEAVYSRNADTVRCMASTTKIMTCILVLESVEDLDTATLQVTKDALADLSYDASVIGLADWDGQSVPVLDVLYGLMLSSGCDAASELAWYVSGGDLNAFVASMNEKAKQLGCENTVYADAHGLSDNNHTTAWDLYRVTKYALELPRFQEIVSTTQYTSATMGATFTTTVTPQNYERGGPYYYPYVHGVKTGFTYAAGRCLVTTATKGPDRYLCVALGAPDDDVNYAMMDSVALYKWAFDNFTDNISVDTSRQFASVQLGSSISLSATVTGNSTGEAPVLTWTSMNPDVAAVSEDGTVTALAPGRAVIQVMSQTGNLDTCTVSCGLYNGLEVSQYRVVEDWTVPVTQGIDFVLVQADNDMIANIVDARSYGFPVGLICPAIGHTDVDAMSAAEILLTQISATDLDLPVFYDITEEGFLSRGAPENTAAVLAFQSTLAAKGLVAGCIAPANANLDWTTLREAGVPLWLDSPAGQADFSSLTFANGTPADYIRFADLFRFPEADTITMYRPIYAVMASAKPAPGAAPSVQAAPDAASGTVSISWTASDWDCLGYRVYRSAGEEPATLLAELSANETAWVDETAEPGVLYSYTVAACSVGDMLNPAYLRDTLSEPVSCSLTGPAPTETPADNEPSTPSTPAPTTPSKQADPNSRYLWLLLLIPIVLLIAGLIYSKVRPHGRHEMAAVGSAKDTKETEESENEE